MPQPTIKTDKRLLCILDGARWFLSALDPEGLLADMTPTQLVLDFDSRQWKLKTVSEVGATLLLNGIIKDRRYLITALSWDNPGTMPDKPAGPSKTVAEALGDLSRVPAHLKQFLSKNALKTTSAAITANTPPAFLQYAVEAVFFKIEDTVPASSKNLFKRWKLNYLLSDQNEPTTVEVTAVCRKNTSMISVSTDLDIYGVGNKKVILTKSLGDNRTAVVECYARQENRTIPSIKVAFDLERVIPTLYSPEKEKRKETKGKPIKTK